MRHTHIHTENQSIVETNDMQPCGSTRAAILKKAGSPGLISYCRDEKAAKGGLETLTRLFARVLFVHHIGPTPATHNDPVFFQSLNRGADFHRSNFLK